MNEDLRQWFGVGDKGGVGGGGWDEYNTKGERTGKCARGENDDGKGPKPKCLSKEKASKMSKSEIASAVKRKRRQDPVADRSGKGGKPKMVSNKIKEQVEDIRYCPMCKKKEKRNECSYGPKMWDSVTVPTQNSTMKEAKKQPDHEHSMIRSELETIRKAVTRLKSKMKGEGNVEAWVQSKITKAADYIDSAADYIESGEHNVHGSMDEEKDPCWKGYKQVGMKKKKGKNVPNCVPEEYSLSESHFKVGDEVICKKSGMEGEVIKVDPEEKGKYYTVKREDGKKMKYAPDELKSYKEEQKEELSPIVSKVLDKHFATEELQTFEEENKPTNPKLWSRAKSLAKKKFDVYPSAYANGWAAKWYKSKGGKWKTSEEVETQEVSEATRIPSQNGNIYMVAFSWRGKMMYIKVFFPEPRRPNRKQVETTINKVYPGAMIRSYDMTIVNQGDSYLNAGSYEGGSGSGKKIEAFGEDWQKVNKSDKTDGMSQAAVDEYRRENPESKLKTAVTGDPKPGSKDAKRKKSFCSRSKGQQDMHNIDCSKTPDKAICKARRRWKC